MGVPEDSVSTLQDDSAYDAKVIENDHYPPIQRPAQTANPLSSVPKRKPVPQTTVVPVDDSVEDVPEPDYGYSFPRREVRVGRFVIPIPFAGNRRKQYILGGVVGGVILLALIIGLAVGLTMKKNGSSNLPLPTSHGGPYTGDLTYYTPALGSCGITSNSDEPVCAVSHYIFDAASVGSNPNANPLCGLKIRLKRGEASVDVTVVDRCVGCEATDIDVSESVFADLAAMELGRVDVQWAWLQDAPVVMPS